MTADLLTEVLDWCKEHPATYPLTGSGQLIMRRHADGSVSVDGEAPEILVFSAELLAAAHADCLTFTDGVLTMIAQPEPLHYRPLGPDPASYAVIFERIREA